MIGEMEKREREGRGTVYSLIMLTTNKRKGVMSGEGGGMAEAFSQHVVDFDDFS